MKNKLKWIVPLFALSMLLAGCPYGSTVPLDKPVEKINPALIGTWQTDSSSNDTYIVSKADDYTYAVLVKEDIARKGGIYKGYLTTLDGDKFLNLWEPDSTNKIYTFYKVTINPTGTNLTLASVTENIDEKFNTSQELKEFFKKYKSLSFFYEKDEIVLTKIK